MDTVCWCFQEHGSPLASDNDDEENKKWSLITQQIENEIKTNGIRRDNSFDNEDEKVKEYNENDLTEPFEMQLSEDDCNDCNEEEEEEEEHENDSEISDESHIHSIQSNISETSTFINQNSNNTKYTTLYENASVDSIYNRPSIYNKSKTMTCTNSINSINSITESTDNEEDSYTSMDNICTQCINFQQKQKQIEIELERIYNRNNELEDKIIEIQTNDENNKRLYDELLEDYSRIKLKNQQLTKLAETNKINYDKILLQTRNKFELELQNVEKNYQQMVFEKNKFELELNKQNEIIEKTQNDLIDLQNKYSLLNVQKIRIENDSKMELQKYEKLKQEQIEQIKQIEENKNELIQQIKKQKLELETEKENNKFLLNTQKIELKKLHSEIAEIKEEKKALIESISLYEKQMVAQQLMDNTELNENIQNNIEHFTNDLNEIKEEIFEKEDDIIPEDEETELFINGRITLKNHNSKSHTINMSISELEPALFIPRMPSNEPSPSLSDSDDDDDDAVYINYETLGMLNKNRAGRHNKSASTQSYTRLNLNVWKDKYIELQSKSTNNAKEKANKDIEINSLMDKINSFENIIKEYLNKIERLEYDLEESQESYLRLYEDETNQKRKHEHEINELLKELNNLKDNITTLEYENNSYIKYKENAAKEYKKKDKLHTKQLKFNEELMNEIFDLNNEVKQLTDINIEMKNKLQSLMIESSESIEKYQIIKKKLTNTIRERKEEKINCKRLKNKVNTLNKEILSLNQTISNLESLFSEHSYLLKSKNKNISHLLKQKEELSTKLKNKNRNHRQLKGFLAAEEDSFKKSHFAKDKRLNMLRETNKKMLIRIEESDKKLIELQNILNDTKIKLKDERTNHKLDNKSLQFKISKLISDNNKIISDKQEIIYEKDKLLNEIKCLNNENNEIKKQIDSTIQSITKIENSYFNFLLFLNKLSIKEDNLYKFVQRCRNIILNTNKLTNKLTVKLIEGCDRAINVYFNCVSGFKCLIDNCLQIKTLFINIEKKCKNKIEFHSYELYQSALCTIYNIGGSSSAASNIVNNANNKKNKRISAKKINELRSTKKILNPKNKDVIPKIPLIARDLIRKPIQSDVIKVPINAYDQIYDLLCRHIESALNNLQNVTNNYSKALNLDIYNEKSQYETKENEFDEPNINWLNLRNDPKTERLYPGFNEINNKRFEEVMNGIFQCSKDFRREQTKELIKLDGAWHRYNLDVGPNNDLSPKISSRQYNNANISTLNENDTNYLSPLTLKVSSQGVHNKRYSIF